MKQFFAVATFIFFAILNTSNGLQAQSGSSGFGVQVASQRSESAAILAYQSLQTRYPNQLGNRKAMIRRVDLGQNGIFFRAEVGPFTTQAQAENLRNGLKTAGGSC